MITRELFEMAYSRELLAAKCEQYGKQYEEDLYVAFSRGVAANPKSNRMTPMLVGMSIQLCVFDAFGLVRAVRNTETLPVPAGWRTALRNEGNQS